MSQDLENETSDMLKSKLLERFRIKVSGHDFVVEIFNKDLSDENQQIYMVHVNGTPYAVEIESLGTDVDETVGATATAAPVPAPAPVPKPGSQPTAVGPGSVVPEVSAPGGQEQVATTDSTIVPGDKILSAPMPGKVLEIKIEVGAQVESGQPLVILEAMKMENVMTAPASGIVKDIPVQTGVNVNQGDVLVVIE